MAHFDTSFVIDCLREARRGRPGPATRLLATLGEDTAAISVHVACELYAGAEASPDPEDERMRIDQFLVSVEIVYPDARFAPTYGKVLARLQKTRQGIAAFDLLIATAALIADEKLVTKNVSHFTRVEGLRVIGY